MGAAMGGAAMGGAAIEKNALFYCGGAPIGAPQ